MKGDKVSIDSGGYVYPSEQNQPIESEEDELVIENTGTLESIPLPADGFFIEKDAGKIVFNPPPSKHHGITRRDWLAGMAMQGLLGRKYTSRDQDVKQHLSEHAYSIADALIKEGNKPNE